MLRNSTSPSARYNVSRSVIHQSLLSQRQGSKIRPPSDLVLRMGAMRISPVSSRRIPAAGFSTLPTLLLHLINSWLIDRDAAQMLMISHGMNKDWQHIYQIRPRLAEPRLAEPRLAEPRLAEPRLAEPRLAEPRMAELDPTPCIALSREEQALQEMCRSFLSARKDLEELESVAWEIACELGGRYMSVDMRDLLLACILGLHKANSAQRMGAMIQGVCTAFGNKISKSGHHYAMLRQILASCKNCSPHQMGAMIEAVCVGLGGDNMPKGVRNHILAQVLSTGSAQQLASMISGVCKAHGGVAIAAAKREALMQQILDLYRANRQLPLAFLTAGLCSGFGGHAMGCRNLNALLTKILDPSKTCTPRDMSVMIETLCIQFGGRNMAPRMRNHITARIMIRVKPPRSSTSGP